MKEKDIVESLIESQERGISKGMRFEIVKVVRDLAIVKDHRIPSIEFPYKLSDLGLALEYNQETKSY